MIIRVTIKVQAKIQFRPVGDSVAQFMPTKVGAILNSVVAAFVSSGRIKLKSTLFWS